MATWKAQRKQCDSMGGPHEDSPQNGKGVSFPSSEAYNQTDFSYYLC